MQNRTRLGLLVAMLLGLLLSGCLSPTASVTRPDGSRIDGHASAARFDLVRAAADQIGTPYRYGGNSRNGFDCSGLVEYAHRHIGLRVPRTTSQQWRNGRSVRTSHLAPGDLVFFKIGSSKSRHVGIYEGNGIFIHAPSSGKRVGRASIDNPYWRKRMIGARSFL